MTPKHGDHPGLNWHKRNGESFCDECREFARRYQAERRRATASLSRYTFPLEMAAFDHESDGLGVTIARALRESA